jgi:hypothetical protein
MADAHQRASAMGPRVAGAVAVGVVDFSTMLVDWAVFVFWP